MAARGTAHPDPARPIEPRGPFPRGPRCPCGRHVVTVGCGTGWCTPWSCTPPPVGGWGTCPGRYPTPYHTPRAPHDVRTGPARPRGNGPLGSMASRGAPWHGIPGNTREHPGTRGYRVTPGNTGDTREHREHPGIHGIPGYTGNTREYTEYTGIHGIPGNTRNARNTRNTREHTEHREHWNTREYTGTHGNTRINKETPKNIKKRSEAERSFASLRFATLRYAILYLWSFLIALARKSRLLAKRAGSFWPKVTVLEGHFWPKEPASLAERAGFFGQRRPYGP